MAWVTWILFESFASLAALAGFVNFWLLVHWRRRGRVRPLLVGLAVGLGLLIVPALVTTQREHAADLLDRIEADVVVARTEALAASLAPDFRAGPWDRDGFVDWAARQLQLTDVQWVNRAELRVEESQHDRFVVSAAYQASVTAEGGFGGVVRSRWRIAFVQTAAGWRIAAIDPPAVESVQYKDWRHVGR